MAASSIAPAQPSASIASPGVHGASHDAVANSFASAMKAMQPASALPAFIGKFPAPQAELAKQQPVSPAKTDTDAANNVSSAMDAMQPVSAPPALVEASPAPQAAPTTQQQVSPVNMAIDAEISVITEAIGSGADMKAPAEGSADTTIKPVHPREAFPVTPGTKRASHPTENTLLAKTSEAVATVPRQNPAATGEQDSTAATAVLIAINPAVAVFVPTGTVAAAKSPMPALQKGNGASSTQATGVTPQALQLAGPVACPASPGVVAQTSATRDSSPDAIKETAFGDNAFSGTAVSSAIAAPAAAVFAPFLAIQASSTSESHVSTDHSSTTVSSTVSSSVDGSSPQPAPVRRLEVAVQDPVLGNLDVRAEMRGGVLHATLTGLGDSAAASMPALRQFLQQHDVAVHSLTYVMARDGVTAPGSTTFSSSDMSRDTGQGGFSGGSYSGSQASERDGSQHQQRYGSSGKGSDESLFGAEYAPHPFAVPNALMADNTLAMGSTLSIHI